jgi:hypothetical protein
MISVSKKVARKSREFYLRVEIRVADDDGGSEAATGFSLTQTRTHRAFSDALEASYAEWIQIARALDAGEKEP